MVDFLHLQGKPEPWYCGSLGQTSLSQQSVLVQGWYQTTNQTFHFTDSSRIFCI